MNEHTQQKIGVVGGGLMGHGIVCSLRLVITSMCLNLLPMCAIRCRSACVRSSNCSVTIRGS